MLLSLTISALCIWIWTTKRDYFGGARATGMWALITGGLLVGLVYQDFTSVTIMKDAFPAILKDFILLGMIGFVQTLAVNKRISVWMAVLLIFGMYAAVYFLDDLIEGEEGTEQISEVRLDPQGEYLIELKTGVTAAEREALRNYAAGHSITLAPAFAPERPGETKLDEYLIADVPDGSGLTSDNFEALAAVNYAEPNEIIQLRPNIDDNSRATRRNPTLSINDPSTAEQWAMEAMQMERYYRLLSSLKPARTAKIAILDTGVDSRHEDLKDNFFSIEKKYNNDPVGHGTHCAGIAAGVTNNGIGIGSLAGSGKRNFTEVTSIKVLNAGGMGTQKTIVAGIIEAVDEGVDVISLSLGGRSNASRQKAYSQAVTYAKNKGIVVIAAAGNSNRPAIEHAPANANGIICVAAVGEDLSRASFSNTQRKIERPLAAPGVAIYSTTPNNNYKRYSGTSMACPFVAGLTGVMRSLRPELSVSEIYDLLHDNGIDGKDVAATGRIVQPAATIEALLSK